MLSDYDDRDDCDDCVGCSVQESIAKKKELEDYKRETELAIENELRMLSR